MRHKRLFVKICGITNLEDALECAKAGANALGFVFYPPSPRYIPPEKAGYIISQIPRNIVTFGVFVNASPEIVFKTKEQSHVDVVQLHGNEPPEWVNELSKAGIKVCKTFFQHKDPSFRSIDLYSCDLALLESGKKGYGGTGKSWLWPNIESLKKNLTSKAISILLAGGITEENVINAIKKARPDGIDLSSGVEKYPGKKDHQKVRRFIAKVQEITADFSF